MMKKRILSLILITVMLLSMTSCKKEQDTNVKNMTLEEYLETVELPKNLTIAVDPSTVVEKETAKIYSEIEWWDSDIDLLAEKLMRNPVTEKSVWAMGQQYRAITDTVRESLIAYDGGEAFFGEAGHSDDGGFYYSISPQPDSILSGPDVTADDYPRVYYCSVESVMDQFMGFYPNADAELDFSSRKAIAEQADAFWKEIGFPDIRVHEVTAYDVDTLNHIVENKWTDHGKQNMQKRDEHYVVLCRQWIDGLPINSYFMEEIVGKCITSSATLKYTQDGLAAVDADNIIQQPTVGIEKELISAAEALECAKKHYGQGILLQQHTIEEMELVYIFIYREDGSEFVFDELRPFWLIKTASQQEFPYPKYSDWAGNPLEGEIKVYDYIYFDAVTGEYCKDSSSGKPLDS